MINPRRSKIRRDIGLYKARAVAVVLAIAVGVMAFGLIGTVQVIVAEKYTATYLASHAAHATLVLPAFDDHLVADVKTVPGVAQAEARRVVSGRIELAPGKWTTLELQAIPDFNSIQIDRLTLEQGGPLPLPDQTMLIESSALSLATVSPGDSLLVQVGGGQTQKIMVAGIVNDPNQIPSSIRPTVYAYLTFATLHKLGVSGDYNRLYVAVDGNPARRQEVEQVITKVSKRIADDGTIVLAAFIPEPGKPVLQDSLQTILIILSVTGFLALVLSGFLVTNVMSALITQQIRQIGVIKAIGGLPRQIIGLYLIMVLILGLIALCLAVPAGMAGAYFLASFVGRQMNFRVTGIYLPPQVFAVQLLGATVVPVLGAMIPVLRGARITVRQAISGEASAPEGRRDILVALLLKLNSPPTPFILPLRNTFRRKVRLFLTLGALGLGGAAFIAVLATREAMQSATRQIQAERDYDLEFDFTGLYPTQQVEQTAHNNPGVADAESWPLTFARRVFEDGRETGSIYLIGLSPTSTMIHPSIREGRWLLPEDHFTLFANAEALDVLGKESLQQDITLKIGGNQQIFRVVGVSSRLLVPIAYIPAGDFASVIGSWPVAHRLVLRTAQRDDALLSKVRSDLLNQFEQAGWTVESSETLTDIKNSAQAQVDNVVATLWAMAVLIALVGILGLSSTMGLNVFERTREIGVLRALGAEAYVIRQLVVGESVTIALVSCLIAAILSMPIGVAFGNALGTSLLLRPLNVVFSVLGLVLWIAMATVAAVAASTIPAQYAINLTVRETLAYDG